MHAALRMNDILSEIFTHLRDSLAIDPDDKFRRQGDTETAYHAALVCKAFLPHALDALWFWTMDLLPLFSLLPETVAVYGNDGELTGLEFATAPVKQDFLVLDQYARRIKACLFREENTLRLNGKAPLVKYVMTRLKRPCLLPKLKYIWVADDLENPQTYPDSRWIDQPICFLLFGPNLRTLKMPTATEDQLLYLLPHLARTTPSLRRLGMDATEIPSKLLHLLQLPGLRYFETAGHFRLCRTSFSSRFSFAANLKSWTAGSLTIRDKDIGRTQSSTASLLFHFPSLEDLKLINQPNISSLRNLFTSASFSNLRRLYVAIDDVGNMESFPYRVKAFFTALFCQGNCLEDLEVGWTREVYVDERDRAELLLDELLGEIAPNRPLLKLHIYEFLTLNFISTSSIRRLAHAFPHLQTLSLSTAALISFDDLALLAGLLPNLLHLRLCGIDDDGLSFPPTVPVLSHRLKTLRIPWTSVGNCSMVARYIDRLFPHVKIDVKDTECYGEGDGLICALEMMQGCRQDETIRNAANTQLAL